jgi:phospholipid transport system substrate-binding protein
MKSRLVTVLGVALLAWAIGWAQAADGDPAATQVQSLSTALLESMRAGSTISTTERYRKLEPVIEQVFALPLVTRLSVGPDWAHFSPDQQQALIAAFTRFTVANYVHNFRTFDGQKFEVDGNVTTRGQHKVVSSQLIPAHDSPVSFHYWMQEVDGSWKIVDIYAEGVSQLALHRTDFVAAIAGGGAPALLEHLKEASDSLMK